MVAENITRLGGDQVILLSPSTTSYGVRNKKLIITLGVIAFLALCVASGDKARMAYLLENAVRTVKDLFGA